MSDRSAATNRAFGFGPFLLRVPERSLTKDGAPVAIGGRALDLLIALVSEANTVLGKRALLASVWPDVQVSEDSLRFHMSALRKALGDARNGARYIETLPGRGYCFVAPVVRPDDPAEPAAEAPAPRSASLPPRPLGMLGRDEDVLKLSDWLSATRFVTIVGPGGVGKTTVAVALGHRLMPGFDGEVVFVDLGLLSDPELVPATIASMLGLPMQADDPGAMLVGYFRERQMLLILDTCEHVAAVIAPLAARIFAEAPRIQILATSREPLEAEGEHVFRLGPLACPPEDADVSMAVIQRFPATRLFLQRAIASGANADIGESDAALVMLICRKLEGLALAIELAARRVQAFGLHQTAALLDEHLTLLWIGLRTAPPRQKTLQATLDWSYGLLSETERTVFRRLAVFVGAFTLEAAAAVVVDDAIDVAALFAALDSLVAKSMVATRPVGAMMRYRLLDMARAHALELSRRDADFNDLAGRHARYYRRWLDQTGSEWAALPPASERAPYLAGLHNVRAALEWCFGPDGDRKAGIELASAAISAFWAMSLLPECHRWSERALRALDATERGGAAEMSLQAGLGIALMNMRGEDEVASAALDRSLALATANADRLAEMGLLGMLHMFHLRRGDYRAALDHAQASKAVAEAIDSVGAKAFADSMLGRGLLLGGELPRARAVLEASLQLSPKPQRTGIYLAADRHYRAGVALARTLWLQGHAEQALARAHQAIEDVTNHPVALTGALAWVIGVFLWAGDLANADRLTGQFASYAQSHALGPNVSVSTGLSAQLAIQRGNAQDGVETLRGVLRTLGALRYGLLTTEFLLALAQGLEATDRAAEALAVVEDAMQLVEASGDLIYVPELLRIKGSLLAALAPDGDEATRCYARSLDISRAQGAKAWELRTAMDFGALLARQGDRAGATALLKPVFAQFTEGLETPDLRQAKNRLARWAAQP